MPLDTRSVMVGLLVGILIGVASMGIARQGGSALPASVLDMTGSGTASVSSSAASVSDQVLCAVEVDAKAWQTYRNQKYGFQISYPADFTAEETPNGAVIKRKDVGNPISITLDHSNGRVASAITSDMSIATWQLASPGLFAVSTPYFNEDENTATSTAVFSRDPPWSAKGGSTPIITATVSASLSDPEFKKSFFAGSGATHTGLTVPEQILSTFHFVPFDELYPKGYNGGGG